MELELVSGVNKYSGAYEFTALVKKGTPFEQCQEWFNEYVDSWGEVCPVCVEAGRIPFHQEDVHTLGLEVNSIL